MKNHLNLDRYYSLDFDERDEIHCDLSIGCIEYGTSTFLEVLRFTSIEEDGHIVFPDNEDDCFFLFIDHNDAGEDRPFQTMTEIARNYDWTKSELQRQYNSYRNPSSFCGHNMKVILFNLMKNLEWDHL